ncbi:MAG: T9SS type A sorting domain-containing protein [Bacteroidaceae bacterium]|nr:T9SS type A sorting domain-containing protein [Bacteroidaceae bacterium]MBO4841227.1 T9SS type A sorting domain-containing protein [Bacteroidaceae bacterium]
MKKIFLLAVMMMACTTMWADKYNYLTVSASGDEFISLPTIQKITFANGNCVVATTAGEYTYPLSEIKKMYFSVEDPTAIEALPQEAKNLQYKDGKLKVEGDGMLRIYGANGALVQMANVKKGANISLSNLKPGMYIVNMGDKTIKLTK